MSTFRLCWRCVPKGRSGAEVARMKQVQAMQITWTRCGELSSILLVAAPVLWCVFDSSTCRRPPALTSTVRKLGAYLIDTKTQRVPLRKTCSLALVTLSTALCCFTFVMVDGTFAVMVSTIGVSLTSTVCPSLEFQSGCSYLTGGRIGYVGDIIWVS